MKPTTYPTLNPISTNSPTGEPTTHQPSTFPTTNHHHKIISGTPIRKIISGTPIRSDTNDNNEDPSSAINQNLYKENEKLQKQVVELEKKLHDTNNCNVDYDTTTIPPTIPSSQINRDHLRYHHSTTKHPKENYSSTTNDPNPPDSYPTNNPSDPNSPNSYPTNPQGYSNSPNSYPTNPQGYPNSPNSYPTNPPGDINSPNSYKLTKFILHL